MNSSYLFNLIDNTTVLIDTEATVQVMSLFICIPYQNAAASRACDAAPAMLPPQHTAAEAVLGVMS